MRTTAVSRWAPFGIVVLLAALVRLFGSGGELWFDEIVSLERHVRQPVASIVSRYPGANNHVFYTLLAHASVAVLGESPFSLRLPALVFGALGVGAFAVLAVRLQGWPVAALATAAFALSPPHVFYSQDARGYTAFVFFALCAVLLAERLAETPRNAAGASHLPRPLAGLAYAATLALGMWTLLLMSFVVLGHALVLVAGRKTAALGWLALGVVIAAILYLPMAGDLARYYASQPAATGHALLSRELWREFLPVLPFLAAGAVLGPPLLWSLVRREPQLGALFLAPLALNVALPLLRGQGVHPRSFVYALPVAYLLFAEALAWLDRRVRSLALVAAAALVLISAVRLACTLELPKQAFREALAFVAERHREGEPVLGLGLAGKALRFYDASVALAEDPAALEAAPDGAWILLTFRHEIAESAPDLLRAVDERTSLVRRFPGQVGDGTIEVRRKMGTL